MNVIYQCFGTCSGDEEGHEAKSTEHLIVEHQRKLVSRLRAISDTSWFDNLQFKVISNGWREATVGWPPTKPGSHHVSISEGKKVVKQLHHEGLSHRRETIPLPFQWRNESKLSLPIRRRNPVFQHVRAVRYPEIHTKYNIKLSVKNPTNHQKLPTRTHPLKIEKEKLLSRGESDNEQQQMLFQRRTVIPEKSLSSVKNDGWTKFITKLPVLNQQIKEDNQLMRRLTARCRSGERVIGPTQVSVDYGAASTASSLPQSLSKSLPKLFPSGKDYPKRRMSERGNLRLLLTKRKNLPNESLPKDNPNEMDDIMLGKQMNSFKSN